VPQCFRQLAARQPTCDLLTTWYSQRPPSAWSPGGLDGLASAARTSPNDRSPGISDLRVGSDARVGRIDRRCFGVVGPTRAGVNAHRAECRLVTIGMETLGDPPRNPSAPHADRQPQHEESREQLTTRPRVHRLLAKSILTGPSFVPSRRVTRFGPCAAKRSIGRGAARKLRHAGDPGPLRRSDPKPLHPPFLHTRLRHLV
jgi:hypothetical protein